VPGVLLAHLCAADASNHQNQFGHSLAGDAPLEMGEKDRALAAVAVGTALNDYSNSDEAKRQRAQLRKEFAKAFGAERLNLHAQALAFRRLPTSWP
jgi:hypothetical protein